MSADLVRIAIRFDPLYGALSSLLLLPPQSAYIEIGLGEIVARMGWAFYARFAGSSVKAAAPASRRPLSRGVHGWGGRWLVNGSGAGLLAIDLAPPQRAFVLGVPVRLRQLVVSVDEPARVAQLLCDASGGARPAR